MRIALIALVLTTISFAGPSAQALRAGAPLFRFETDELWLNLHHFLYVLGRAEAKTADSSRDAVRHAPEDAERGLAGLNDAEKSAWRDAVALYAKGLSQKDAVFDRTMSAFASALARARDAQSLDGVSVEGVDPAVLRSLERVAPIYRKAWWPAHREAHTRWLAETSALVDRHGRTILDFITHAYGMPWAADGYPVHLVAYANWAGAYSTSENLLVVSTLDAGNRGTQGLETVFHEGMHQWDDQMIETLRAEARRIDKRLPPNLSHAMIFFTAGEAVRRTVPGHVPLADTAGVWARGMQTFKAPLEETWKLYLDGRGTRDEAIAALLRRVAIEPPR